MPSLDTVLLPGCVLVVLAWAAMSLYVLAVERWRADAHRVLTEVLAALGRDEVRSLPLDERSARVRPLLDRTSLEMVLQATADAAAPVEVFEVLAAHLAGRRPVARLVHDASSHRTARDKWRRSAALRVLFRLNHPARIELASRAVDDSELDVATVGLSLLGGCDDPRALEVMIGALRRQRHPASRIAAHIEASPLWTADAVRPLLRDPEPALRAWGATLMGKYIQVDGLEQELVALSDDSDPRVRKAAVQSLGRIGHHLASITALRLLHDPVAYVRAHAARALADLDRPDTATAVAALLGDTDWWVRQAAKESLEAMGSDVWPVLVRCLDHPDRFVENGAAEVIQNLGILDTLIVMEAATDRPSPSKIEMLRRIFAAGGVRLTDSLFERVGPLVGPRMRELLTRLELDRVEVC